MLDSRVAWLAAPARSSLREQARHRIMLRITTYIAEDECLFKLEGDLTDAWVRELARCWGQVTATPEIRRVGVDLTDVGRVDTAGRELMTTMYRRGVRFSASGFVMPELLREISQSIGRRQRS
jgi:ABC-type transporter Mla MlaB component